MSELNESTIIAIAEKLDRVTANVDKVFEAGRRYELKNTYEKGYADGRAMEYDAFWNLYQENGVRTNYDAAFGGIGWNDESFKPKHKIKPTLAHNMFYACDVTDGWEYIKDMSFSLCSDMSGAFAECSFVHLGQIDCRGAGALDNLFASASQLKTVDAFIVGEQNTFINTFKGVSTLENISFAGTVSHDIDLRWCKKLTRASIESLVAALSDKASGMSLILSCDAVDEAFKYYWDERDEEGNLIFTPGSISVDWRDLERSKPDWVITLV